MTDTPLEPQDPQPGAWVSKKRGLSAQLIRVDRDICWYTIPESLDERQMFVSAWLDYMRPA